MKRLALLILILAILGAGGTLTALTGSDWSATAMPGAKVQCADPACSVFLAEPWQAGQLILLVGFILFNMIGIGATLAIVLWFLNKQVATVRAQPSADTQNTASIEKGVRPLPRRSREGNIKSMAKQSLSQRPRLFIRLALTVTVLTIALVVFGAVVRVTDSGLGCNRDWPLCGGTVFPPLDNLTAWIEWLHRLFAILIGLLGVGMLVAAVRAFSSA